MEVFSELLLWAISFATAAADSVSTLVEAEARDDEDIDAVGGGRVGGRLGDAVAAGDKLALV